VAGRTLRGKREGGKEKREGEYDDVDDDEYDEY
jgi:hypothetical protein